MASPIPKINIKNLLYCYSLYRHINKFKVNDINKYLLDKDLK